MNYSLFGLHLRSNQTIPGLTPIRPAPVDVDVSLGAAPAWVAEIRPAEARRWYVSPFQDRDGQPVLAVSTLDDGHLTLRFSEGAAFVIDRNGSHVWGSWTAPLSIADAASYLFGPVLGLVLRLRGITPLHASAIAVNGRAVALAGADGAGKSTLAGAFALDGDPVMTDDLLALPIENDHCYAQPGVPWLRLKRESAEVLQPLAALPPLTLTADDGYLDLDLRQPGFRHEATPQPLAAVFLLGDRLADTPSPSIERLHGSGAVTSLAATTWAMRLLDPQMRAQELDVLSWIANHVPVFRVRLGSGAQGLARARQLVRATVPGLEPATYAVS